MTPDQLRQCLEAAGIEPNVLGFVREADVARALDVDVRTLQRYRGRGVGPAAALIGKRWWYSLDAISAFINSTSSAKQRQSPTEHDKDAATKRMKSGEDHYTRERDDRQEKSE